MYRPCRTLNQCLKVVVAAIHCLTSRRFVKPPKIDPQNVQQNMTNDQLNLPRPFKEVQKWPLNSFFYNFTCHQTEGNPNTLGPFSNMSLRASAQKLSRLPLVDFYCLKECLPSMSPCITRNLGSVYKVGKDVSYWANKMNLNV